MALGTWNVSGLIISTGGVFGVYTNNGGVPQSGTLFIHANTILVETNGVIDGNYSGNDPRGKGHDWYRNSSGGGHGGRGGRGYWDSSGGGNEGQSFGSPFTYESFMGGAGGYFGGGSIFIEAEESITIDGQITANGITSYNGYIGGGAGGGVLIRSPLILGSGRVSVNGGNGYVYSGGGGGGRAKYFCNGSLLSLITNTSATGGTRGGYLNTAPGQSGSIYRDYIPRVPSIIAPLLGESVTNGSIVFRFTVEDLSGTLDGHLDTISPVIELSRDGFQTIAYQFNLDETVAGWNKVLYYSGDTVEFRPQVPIEAGVYSWRVKVRDGSLYSRPTTPRALGVETRIPGPIFSLDVFMVPEVVINGGAGRYRVDWTSSLNLPINWSELVTLVTTNNPTYYFDVSGIGRPKRFYRAELLPWSELVP